MGFTTLFCTVFAGLSLDACEPPSVEAPPPIPPATRGELVRRFLPGEPALSYLQYVPSGGGADAPLLVVVHGISRNAERHARTFARTAERRGAVLVAPVFRRGDFADYQRLGRSQRGPRADRALARLLESVAAETGAAADAVLLFGYSGGAQFVHRFALAHPDRVAAAAVASPGWYTFPDPDRWYPYGIRETPRLPGVEFEPEDFLRVPMLVTVGENDTHRGRSFRRSRWLDRWQGRTRVERARRWVQAMEEAAALRSLPAAVELVVLDDVHHSFSENVERAGLDEIVAGYLFAPEQLARVRPRPERLAARASDL